MVSGFSVYNILIRSCTFLKVSHNSLVLEFCVKLCLVCFFSNMQYLFICLFILNFLLLFNYSCMPFLPIPPPHPTPAKPLSLPHQIVLVFKVFCSLPNCCVGSLCQFERPLPEHRFSGTQFYPIEPGMQTNWLSFSINLLLLCVFASASLSCSAISCRSQNEYYTQQRLPLFGNLH